MKTGIYSIFDFKAQTFAQPMFFINDDVAVRALANAVRDKTSYLNAAPADYEMYKLGEFDDVNGTITPDSNMVARCIDLLPVSEKV